MGCDLCRLWDSIKEKRDSKSFFPRTSGGSSWSIAVKMSGKEGEEEMFWEEREIRWNSNHALVSSNGRRGNSYSTLTQLLLFNSEKQRGKIHRVYCAKRVGYTIHVRVKTWEQVNEERRKTIWSACFCIKDQKRVKSEREWGRCLSSSFNWCPPDDDTDVSSRLTCE